MNKERERLPEDSGLLTVFVQECPSCGKLIVGSEPLREPPDCCPPSRWRSISMEIAKVVVEDSLCDLGASLARRIAWELSLVRVLPNAIQIEELALKINRVIGWPAVLEVKDD